MKALIVDDATFMRASIRKMLDKLGFEICEAENGEVAVKKFKEDRPDIITMDLTMPVMDGLEAIKRIMDFDKSAVIIAVSAMGQEKHVMEAMKNGAKDFVLKPIKEERLNASIKKIFKEI